MTILEKSRELKQKIKNATSIFIMGHKDLDLDALGAAIGIYSYIQTKGKKCFIIVDDKKQEPAVKKMHELINDKYKIIKSSDLKKYLTKKDLLIVVDTNKKMLVQNTNIVDIFEDIVVIDHHDITEKSFQNCLMIVDTKASSACEMIAEFLENNKIEMTSVLSTILLAGIVLDTNNYVLKTTCNTFKMSYFLSMNGADPQEVQYILKQDLKKYIERQKVITNVNIIKQVAVSCGKYKTKYRREDLAKIADTLLLFNKIEASFVVGRIDKNTIGISARSLGNIDIGKILEIFGGGGSSFEAAAKISGSTIKKVKEEIMDIVKKIQ